MAEWRSWKRSSSTRRRSLVQIQSRPPWGISSVRESACLADKRPPVRPRHTPPRGDGPTGRRGLRKPEMGVRFSLVPKRAHSQVGMAPALQAGDHGFDSHCVQKPHRPQWRGAASVRRRCRVRTPGAAPKAAGPSGEASTSRLKGKAVSRQQRTWCMEHIWANPLKDERSSRQHAADAGIV